MLRQHDPAAQRLYTVLKERIEHGHYHAETWLPTERDLAAEFSVSRAVVRAALTRLSDKNLIVRRHGHRPWVSDLRQSGANSDGGLSSELLTIIAILPQQTVFPSSLAILSGINRALRASRQFYRLVIFNNFDDRDGIDANMERDALRIARSEGSGVILWSMNIDASQQELLHLRDSGVPFVCIDRFSDQIEADFVGVDNRNAAVEAVNCLINLGHTRIGYIAADEYHITTTTRDRATGFREALTRHHLFAPELICTIPVDTFGNARSTNAANYFMGLQDPPTAVFANNDYIAYRFISDLEQCGLETPRDISVIGFDDLDQFSPRPARLASVHQPFELMGQRAAELLLYRRANGGTAVTAWRHLLLPTQLLIRETCRKRTAC